MSKQKEAMKRHEEGIETIYKFPRLIGIGKNFEKRKNYKFRGLNKNNQFSTLEVDIIFYNKDKSFFIEYKGKHNKGNLKTAKRQLNTLRKNLKNIEQKFLSPEIHFIYVGGDPQSTRRETMELIINKWKSFY